MKKILITTLIILSIASMFWYGVVYAFEPQYNVNAGLVAHWSLDTRHTAWTGQKAGTVLDMSGTRKMTLFGMDKATSTTRGKIGEGFLFNGTSYIGIPVITRTTPVTMTAWVKYDGTKAGAVISQTNEGASNFRHIYLGVTSSNKAITSCLISSSYTKESTDLIPSDTWTFIAASYSSGTMIMHLYVNGVSQGTQSCFAGISGLIDYTSIGVLKQTPNLAFYAGAVDDVRIYNRILSGEELRQLYRQGLSGNSR